MQIKGTAVFEAVHGSTARITCVRGGTRSSKSYSLTQLALFWLMTGFCGKREVRTGVFFIVRATFPALRQSVLKDFINLAFEYGFYRYIEHRKTSNEFIFQGREIVFFSTDDEQKLKGRGNSIFWINEADSVPYDHFFQLLIRNTNFCFLDYNPSGSPWVKDLETDRAKDIFLHVSTYKQNPFLGPELIKEIENLKLSSPDLHKIYTLGEWVERSGRVFKNVETFEDWPTARGSVYWGMDWGFTDPSVLVEVRIYETEKKIYIKELLHGPGLLLTDISAAIYANNCGVVICDGADPRSIDELRRRGNRVQASFKGTSSVMQGINRISQYRIHINGANVLNDFKTYYWKMNLNGDIIPVPEHGGSHSPDAVRYAISYSMRSKIRLI